MKRRELFRNFLLIYAGASLLPACAHDEKKSGLAFKNLQISVDQEASMESLAETIIPQTDSPGSKSLQSHLYVLMMVDECKSAKEQVAFMKGLDHFRTMARSATGSDFVEATPSQKAKFL